MVVVFQWWIIVKIAILLACCYAVYKAGKARGKSRVWNLVAIISIFLWIVNPVKVDLSKTKDVTNLSNTIIEDSKKELPPMVEDNSFRDSVDSVKPISKEYLK